MASTLTLLSLSKLAEIHSNSLGISILFPVGKDGLATVMALHISIRFCLQETFVWVEREVYNPLFLALSHTIPEASKHSNDGSIIWTLKLDRYKVYGLTTFQMFDPTQFVIPRQIFHLYYHGPLTVRVKIEPCVQAIIELSVSFEDDAPPPPPHVVSPIPGASSPSYTPLSLLYTPVLKLLPTSTSKQS